MARRNISRYIQYAKQKITNRLLDGKRPVPTCVALLDRAALSFSNLGGRKTVTKTHSYLFIILIQYARTHERIAHARGSMYKRTSRAYLPRAFGTAY